MNKDVTILYQGGSGGFALFYYLLLSNNFVTGIDYKDINELINHQYPDSLTTNPRDWKKTEVWPDNLKCKKMDGRKLFLICNPLWDMDVFKENLLVSDNTHKILLYADFKLQLRMCWEKQAYWFTDISRKSFDAPASNKKYLRQIMNTKINDLDPMIYKISSWFNPNQLVDLKKFVTTKTLTNFDPPNDQQLKFLDRWVSLQPNKVKNALLR